MRVNVELAARLVVARADTLSRLVVRFQRPEVPRRWRMGLRTTAEFAMEEEILTGAPRA